MNDHRIIGIYDAGELREVRYVSVKPQPKPRRRSSALGWVALSALALAVAIVACPAPSPARVVACTVRVVTTPALIPQWIIDWLWGHNRTIGRRPGIRTSIVSAGTAS